MPKSKKTFDKYEYDKQYCKENYYRMNIAMKKEMREIIDAAASKVGMSKNAFIIAAIKEKVDKVNQL